MRFYLLIAVLLFAMAIPWATQAFPVNTGVLSLHGVDFQISESTIVIDRVGRATHVIPLNDVYLAFGTGLLAFFTIAIFRRREKPRGFEVTTSPKPPNQ